MTPHKKEVSETFTDYLIKAGIFLVAGFFFAVCVLWLLFIWLVITTPATVVIP